MTLRPADGSHISEEARFREIAEASTLGMAVLAADRILYMNEAGWRKFGASSLREMCDRPLWDLVPPDDVAPGKERLAAAAAGRLYGRITLRCLRLDGGEIYLESEGWPIRYEGQDAVRVTFDDATERRMAEGALRESEERFRSVWETSVDGLRLVDADGLIRMVNDAYCRMVEMPAEELVGQPYTKVYQEPLHGAGLLQQRLLARDIPRFMESNITLWNGRDLWFAAANTIIEREGREPLLLSSFRDATEERRTREALQRYRLLAENSNDIMLFLRPDGFVVEANHAAERAYGYSRDELTALTLNDLAEPSADGAETLVSARDGAVFPARHRRANGDMFPVEISVQTAEVGGESLFLAVIRDTTERAALERELRHQAFHDPLTKLPNRLLFMDRLEQTTLRRNGRATVLFLDLDRFKNINDSLGHAAGDQLLVGVAGRLKSCIRAADTAARLGGDEFTILLDGCDDTGEATRTAKRILRKLEAPFEVNGQEVFVSASIGVAMGRSGGTTAEDLLREADLAMYQAKTSGKARHAVFVRERSENSRGRLQLETDLRRAIERGEFQVYYQPVVLMETKRTIAVEALTRWNHPRFGLMPPDEFVPLQEQIGVIEPFTMWVLNEALQHSMEMQRQGMRVSVAVNLSPYNLREPDFAARVGEMLKESGAPPSSLKLEITESAIMTNPERALRILGMLNEMGVRLSVDDFGTGYSSLTYLKQLPVHEIKIDKSFVIGMDASDEDDAAIVRATIDLAHNLHKKVVAEGVETTDVWDLLNVLGCDAAQGYHMSPPLPASDLISWLKDSPFGLGRMK